MFALLTRRRFAPLFGALFLNAFNDNLYRTALLFLITYQIVADDPAAAAQLVTLSAGVFVAPYVLFSGLAGQVADAVDKAKAARRIKAFEILVMATGAASMWVGSVPLMLLVLFAMGLQSTFFGPIKYSLLPQHLSQKEVTGGTALVEAGTFLAVLTGQIVGGLITPDIAMAGIVVIAIIGWLVSRGIPDAPPQPGAHVIQINIFASSWGVLKYVAAERHLLLCVIGISWYWALGTVFTSLFIPLVKGALGGTEPVATLFLAAFSVGLAAGSLVIGKVLSGIVSARTLPVSLVLMSVAILDLYFSVSAIPSPAPGAALAGPADFLASARNWRILGDLTLLAIGGGTFIVPLYTILQMRSDPAARARVIAGNNIVNCAFMMVGALGAGALLTAGMSEIEVLLLIGVINIAVVPLAVQLKRALVRFETEEEAAEVV
ncbi:MFS transporter [Pacificimonas sp. WHA3]|uniref:MFS transporter n=1 Tax=Pacificimonas pallii TaxID=2827236 RepID=A0ABS6SBJ3_9SPHN|nr:MFS transporter [Pacificimonas pallii]